jgi:hypothetical protein
VGNRYIHSLVAHLALNAILLGGTLIAAGVGL